MQNLSQRMMADVFSLVESEVLVARLDMQAKLVAGARAGIMFGLALSFIVVALASLSVAIVAGLSAVIPLWVAAIVVAAARGACALVLVDITRADVARVGDLTPHTGITEPEQAAERADDARRRLDRTAAVLTERGSGNSPMRDAVLSAVGIVLSAGLSARSGRR